MARGQAGVKDGNLDGPRPLGLLPGLRDMDPSQVPLQRAGDLGAGAAVATVVVATAFIRCLHDLDLVVRHTDDPIPSHSGDTRKSFEGGGVTRPDREDARLREVRGDMASARFDRPTLDLG